MKKFHCISAKATWKHMKSGVSQSKNSTISQAVRAGALSCWRV